MRNEKNETISDIAYEMRSLVKSIGTKKRNNITTLTVRTLMSLADLIEAAEKSERETGSDASNQCAEIGDMIGCETDYDKSSHVSNAEKMREALMEIQLVCWKAGVSMGYDVACGIIKAKSRDALSAQMKNCYKYNTADEAYACFRKFCDNSSCSECRFDKNTTTCLLSYLYSDAEKEVSK